MELSEIKEKLAEHLNTTFLTAPYLFVGSGLSKRYLGLENWEELLTRYCKVVDKPFRYYKDSVSGDLGQVASKLSEDFFDFGGVVPITKLAVKNMKKLMLNM